MGGGDVYKQALSWPHIGALVARNAPHGPSIHEVVFVVARHLGLPFGDCDHNSLISMRQDGIAT